MVAESSKRVEGEVATKMKQILWHRQVQSIRESKGLHSTLLSRLRIDYNDAGVSRAWPSATSWACMQL